MLKYNEIVVEMIRNDQDCLDGKWRHDELDYQNGDVEL